MGFELDQIVYGDTSYIQKLEAWRQALQDKIDDLDTFLGSAGSAATLIPTALLEILDRRGIIGRGSYDFNEGTLSGPSYNLTVAAGAYVNAAGTLYRKTSSSTISLLGFSTGTLYVNLSGLGEPTISTTPDATTTRQFSWSSTTHAVSSKALYTGVSILLDGDDYNDLLSSTARAKSFTSLGDRIEEIEVLLSKTVQTPASADTININWALGGHARITLDRATTTINMSGAYDSQKCTLELVQDGVGGRAVSFGAEVAAGTDFTLPAALSAAASKRDFLGFMYSGGNSKYNYVSLSRGY